MSLPNSEYWGGVQRMIYFGVIQVTAMIGLAIALALFLDSAYCKGRKFFALVYFLPYAVPGVIAAIMWAFLLERGARMDVFAAAMLGHLDIVRATIAAIPQARTWKGPHGIPLLMHAEAGGAAAAPVADFLRTLAS